MQKIIIFPAVLAFCFISSNALAEWVIPGTHCVAENGGNVSYAYNGIMNQDVPADSASASSIFVSCTSPVQTSYGNNLDLDFYIENNSRNLRASCYGHSLDAYGRTVHVTSRVWAEPGTGHNGITATQDRTIFNSTPVTVVAYCFIPDRGVNSQDAPSKLVSIRVY